MSTNCNHRFSTKNTVLFIYFLVFFSGFSSVLNINNSMKVKENGLLSSFQRDSKMTKDVKNIIQEEAKSINFMKKEFSNPVLEKQQKPEDKKIENLDTSSIASSAFSIFISGFGDKSFFISTIASVSYNKVISTLGSFTGLVIMGIISMFMGFEVSQFVPLYVIDVVSSVLFLLMGIKMIIEAVETSEDEHFIKLTKAEITKNVENYINENENENKQEEKILFEICGTTDDEKVKSSSHEKLQKEFEQNFENNVKKEKKICLVSKDTEIEEFKGIFLIKMLSKLKMILSLQVLFINIFIL